MLSRSLAVRRGRERREDIEGGVERWTESVDLKHYGNKLLQGGRKYLEYSLIIKSNISVF